jgi:hypothetical protein
LGESSGVLDGCRGGIDAARVDPVSQGVDERADTLGDLRVEDDRDALIIPQSRDRAFDDGLDVGGDHRQPVGESGGDSCDTLAGGSVVGVRSTRSMTPSTAASQGYPTFDLDPIAEFFAK